MGPSVLTVVACAPILAGWLAMCACQYLSVRRQRRCDTDQRRHDAEWASVTLALADLDADLDRIWGAEQARIQRPW